LDENNRAEIGRLHRQTIELEWNVEPSVQLITQDLVRPTAGPQEKPARERTLDGRLAHAAVDLLGLWRA
jgi:hypothetical protein